MSHRSLVTRVDAHQEDRSNPFGMDEECRRCEALCETRERVVHGYGDVGADFAFVGAAPSRAADEGAVPFADGDGRTLFDLLEELGLCGDAAADEPPLTGVFCTNVTRCRHPDRGPTEAEVGNCDAFLTAEIRMINPEILFPVGDRALEVLVEEYTTHDPAEYDVVGDHATRIRGRGFELVPTVEPDEMSDDQATTFVESVRDIMASDYRQTKGRRSR